MNDLQIFENSQFGKIRAIEKDGEPWFVAADVCRALEIADTWNALQRLDDDEKDTCLISTPGGIQEMSIANEPGLYSLVLGSRKPEAKSFKRWITHEVIPSIRKTGTYSVRQTDPTKQSLAEAKLRNSRAREASVWLKIAKEVSIPSYKDICAHYASTALAGKEVLPLPESTERTYTAAEVGKMLGGVSANMVGRVANQNSLKTREYGIEVWDKSPNSAKQVPTWRYNDKAVEKLRKLFQ